jgi:hypothetical protein
MGRSALRRAERFSLGVVFGVAAWIIERRVMKAIRRRGESPPAGSTMADLATSELQRPQP